MEKSRDNQSLDKILIVSIAPYFLEKGFVWFEENQEQIEKARKTQTFWQENTLLLEKNEPMKLYKVLRKLDEIGYEKVFKVDSPGEFSQTGGVIEVFPVNSKTALRLDFLGNKIESIEKIGEELQNEEVSKNLLKKKLRRQKMFSDLKGLRPGDYLVHLDHGVGKFSGTGITRKELEGVKLLPEERKEFNSFLGSYYVLEYAQGDKLYVPVGLERKLSKYVGFTEPKLNRLGGVLWQKTKRKIKEDAEKFAKELLTLFAQKETAQREPYLKSELVEVVASSFPYQLTADQEQTIKEIEQDLAKKTPMDRLVCGDVGFGKTEIALRAAVMAVENGRQVAIVAPTTILASQHFDNLKKRLSQTPIKVALLCRLQNASENKETKQGLKNGAVDIVIATHGIFSKTTEFYNLGLLVIDDEQKFGVKQKEIIREKHPVVDVLYLSATPIPRSLYMALSSLKKLSFVQTPPEGRKAIKTLVLPFGKKIIKQAIAQELKRKGQIYFLHNRVETIYGFQKQLELLKTKASIAVLHAKMPEKAIIETLSNFQKGAFDILLSTTIIENGIDLANANTLIVDNATRLGLAQAYQLRGRVGRSDKQAFAYFMYPPKSLKGKAKQRLKALKEAQELGSGYRIATADLEIRGAGNILGREQSGAVNRVGLNLYCQMLSEAVEKLKNTRPS